MERGADNFMGLETGAWDAVILNSVVQYFPSVEYLLRVVERAVQLVAPGGVAFIGDVRSLPLLEAFHATVQVQQAPATLSREQLRQRVHESVCTEEELVLDPAFFWTLPERLWQIRQVEVQLKRGETSNALTRFRYDVVLHVGAERPAPEEPPWLDWQQVGGTVTGLRQQLVETMPAAVGVRGVPNARVQAAVQAGGAPAPGSGTRHSGRLASRHVRPAHRGRGRAGGGVGSRRGAGVCSNAERVGPGGARMF